MPASCPVSTPLQSLIDFENVLSMEPHPQCFPALPFDFLLRRPPYVQSLIDFENVLSMEPKNYLGDDFSRVTQIYRVTQYNIGGWPGFLSLCRVCAESCVTQIYRVTRYNIGGWPGLISLPGQCGFGGWLGGRLVVSHSSFGARTKTKLALCLNMPLEMQPHCPGLLLCIARGAQWPLTGAGRLAHRPLPCFPCLPVPVADLAPASRPSQAACRYLTC